MLNTLIICLSVCDMLISSLVKTNNNDSFHFASWEPVNKISDADFKVCRDSFKKACQSVSVQA